MYFICLHNTFYHSTIFNTITNDVESSKLSINSGTKNLFSGDFFNKQSILSNDDISALKAYNAVYQDFVKKIENIYGAKVQGRINNLTHLYTSNISLSGDLDDIYAQMQNIRTLAQNMGLDDSYINALSKQMEKTKNTLDSYQEIYNEHVLYDKIFDNGTYEKSFNSIKNAYKQYRGAYASGDDEAVEKAKQSFAEIVQGATEGVTDSSVVDYFINMYPDLQDVVSGWLFEVHFKAAVNDEKDDFEKDVKNAASRFSSSEDILHFNSKTATDKQIEAYAVLQKIAADYQTDIDGLVARMQ